MKPNKEPFTLCDDWWQCRVLIWSHWVCLVTPRFATGLNSSLLPGRVPCFAELSTEFRKPEHWTEQELSAHWSLQAPGTACVPNVAGGNPSAAREPSEYWTNYLFLAPTHLIITRTYQIEFPHLLLIWCQKLSGYFQTFEWIIHHWHWSDPSFVPCYDGNPSYAKPNFACKQHPEQHYTRKIFLSVCKLIGGSILVRWLLHHTNPYLQTNVSLKICWIWRELIASFQRLIE